MQNQANTMNRHIRRLWLPIFAASVIWSATAQASFIFSLTFGADNGSIELPTIERTPTGSDASGVIFSFNGFDQSNIATLSWSSADAGLNLNLDAIKGDIPCNTLNDECQR